MCDVIKIIVCTRLDTIEQRGRRERAEERDAAAEQDAGDDTEEAAWSRGREVGHRVAARYAARTDQRTRKRSCLQTPL